MRATRARLGAVVVALGLAAVACSSDDREQVSQGAPPTPAGPTAIPQKVTPHEPPGAEGDELAGLAPTEARGRMLASTVDQVRSVLLIDLGTRRTVTVAVDEEPMDPGVLTPDGAAVATGARTISFVDARGRAVASAELPPEVAGTISTVSRADDGVVVDVAPPRDADGRWPPQGWSVVVYDLEGRQRCVAGGFSSGTAAAGHLWSDELRTRLDLGTCATSTGLRPGRGQDTGWPMAADGAAVYAMVGSDRIGRFRAANGSVVARSADLGEHVSGIAVSSGLWVLVDDRLLRLDEGTLEIREQIYRFPCPEGGQVVADRSRVYVVSCDGALYAFESGTGAVVDAWGLPHDQFSDQEPWATMTAEGIWIVDPEQSGEPYLFNPRRGRFERLPLDQGVRRRISAVVFDVMG